MQIDYAWTQKAKITDPPSVTDLALIKKAESEQKASELKIRKQEGKLKVKIFDEDSDERDLNQRSVDKSWSELWLRLEGLSPNYGSDLIKPKLGLAEALIWIASQA